MPVPRFDSIEDAAEYVLTHHRLPALLNVGEVAEFVRHIFNEADGEASLPSLVMQFFRGKIEQADREMEGE